MQTSQEKPKNQNYQNPKIYHDLESVLFDFLDIHKNLSKVYRVTILEQHIYSRINASMTNVLNIGLHKACMSKQEINQKINLIICEIVIVKSYVSFLLLRKIISEGFYTQTYKKLEAIGKQLVGWGKFLLKPSDNK